MLPSAWDEVIGGRRYRTETSSLIASDAYFDGHNWERSGRNRFLYKTANNNYFLIIETRWQGERSMLIPLTVDDALKEWESLPEHDVSWTEAFPSESFVEA